MVNSWRKSHVALTKPLLCFYAVTTLPHTYPTLAPRLRQARLFVRVNVGSWVSLKVHVSNVRPIYVRIELRG